MAITKSPGGIMDFRDYERLYHQDPGNWDALKNYAIALIRSELDFYEIIEALNSEEFNIEFMIWCAKESLKFLPINYPPSESAPSIEWPARNEEYNRRESINAQLRTIVVNIEKYLENPSEKNREHLEESLTVCLILRETTNRRSVRIPANLLYYACRIAHRSFKTEVSGLYRLAMNLDMLQSKRKGVKHILSLFLDKGMKNPIDIKKYERRLDLEIPETIIDYLNAVARLGQTKDIFFSYLLKYYKKEYDYKLLEKLESLEDNFLSKMLDDLSYTIAQESGFSEYERDIIPFGFYTSECLEHAFIMIKMLESENEKNLFELFEIYEECPETSARDHTMEEMFAYHIYHSAAGSGTGLWEVCPEIKSGYHEAYVSIPAPFIVTIGHPVKDEDEYENTRKKGECKIGSFYVNNEPDALEDYFSLSLCNLRPQCVWEADYDIASGKITYTPITSREHPMI